MTSPIAQPRYGRGELTVGVVHMGVGNFHRAHQAMYFDRLFDQAIGRDWAICGIGLTDYDAAVRDALEAQSMRYTLVERSPDGSMAARSVASIVDVLHAPDDVERVIERLADPQTRVVTLTITEGGYNIDDTTGDFDGGQSWVAVDVRRGDAPQTVFGLVVEALRRRRHAGRPPFTIVSCDNLPGNGDIAQRSFASFADLRDPELGAWIHAEVPFPNSMVDRITPATGDLERELVTQTYGVQDAWPVICEDFSQWVLEDRFAAGRPPLEAAGVQIVANVEPYEKMKLRLLNASHQALAYFGYLLGYRFTHEAIGDPDIAAFARAFMKQEAEGTLEPVPGVDLDEYQASLMSRFANPYIKDTLMRLSTDASDRIPKFVLPVVADRASRDQPSPLSAAIVASWAVFARGVDEAGAPIEVRDRRARQVRRAAQRQTQDGLGFLQDRRIFGDLAESENFAPYFTQTYQEISRQGARRALGWVLDNASSRWL